MFPPAYCHYFNYIFQKLYAGVSGSLFLSFLRRKKKETNLKKEKHADCLIVKIPDTYDFNKDGGNPLVQMGYRIQEAGLLNPYITVVKCRYKLKWK